MPLSTLTHTHTHMCFVPVFCPLCFYIPFFVCVSFQCCLSVFFQSFTSISASIVFLTLCVSIFTFCVVYLVCFDDHISNMICNALWCFLDPIRFLSRPVRNNFSWAHRWAETLPSGLRDPSNRIFSESPWCQLSKFKYRDKYKDKYRDKYKDRDK